MLRRNTPTNPAEAETTTTATEGPEIIRPGDAVPGTRADRRDGSDRRQGGDRRGMDSLRAEALQNVLSRVEDRNFGGLRNRFQWHRGFPIKPSRLILLAVALVAGGLAAYLATSHPEAAAPPAAPVQIITIPVKASEPAVQEKVIQEPRTKILVAKADIGVGERLTPDAIEWADWPQGAVRQDYVTVDQKPDAATGMSDSVARFEIFAGEPIRSEKIVTAADGYLSAVLDPGMRAVSVSVSAEAASGGFIVPNDRVDVVFIRTSANGQVPETILHDIKVLAINARLGELGKSGAPDKSDGRETPKPNDQKGSASDPKAQMFLDHALATLEVDPTQAEALANAATQGKLTLVLRPIADTATADKLGLSPADQAIRMTSPFWTK